MEECFLSNKTTLTKPSGGSFTSREIDVISGMVNGGTAKSISKLLGISHHTVGNYIASIRGDLNFCSQDQVIKFVESSGKYLQIRERYIDFLLFSKLQETLEKIKTLKKVNQKYKCVIHIDVGDVGKCILLDYLRLAGIEVDISYDSTHYESDKFHIICCSERSHINLESLNTDNIVVNENHSNNAINLTGKCIKLDEHGSQQYKSYFSLLGCIGKIYSSQKVDDILSKFKEYYHNIKDGRLSTNLERNQIEITDKRKSKHLTLFFIILLIMSATTYWYAHWYNEINKTVLATNINILIEQSVFLKRKDLTSKMDKILEKQKGTKFLALVGQGGMGKTTLAKNYAYTSDAKIKWEVNAGTEESAIKSFLELIIELSKNKHEIRDELKYIQAIEDPEIKKKSIISFVFSQLKANSGWCLLFDNVDNFKMIHAFIPSNKDLCGEGTIIITTRNANCGNVSFIPDKMVLNIEYLGKSEKKELFYNILYGEQHKLSKDKIEEIDKFLENIPPMPLDVSNAAYYIKNTNSSFEKYLEIVQSPNEETETLQSKFLEEGTVGYNKTRYKITLAIFNELIEINPNFKELLLFICLLDSQNIPRKYLDQCKRYAIASDFIHIALLELSYCALQTGYVANSLSNAQASLDLLYKKNMDDKWIAIILSNLGIIYALNSNFIKSKKYFETALEIASKTDKAWARFLTIELNSNLLFSYTMQYINRNETYKALNYVKNALYFLSLQKASNKNSLSKKLKSPFLLLLLKCDFAIAYNALGMYKEALCSCKDAYKILSSNDYLIRFNVSILLEEACALLRQNYLIIAREKFRQLIEFGKTMSINYCIFITVMRMVEIQIRLGELDDAYKNSMYALNFKNRERNNYTDIIYNACHYHAAIIKLKQQDYILALKHFSDFFNNMNTFCKGFLEKEAFEKLVSENVFEVIKDKSRIKECLQNSLKIFLAIYGENHSFIKYYVAENCKDYSWNQQKLIILWHYVRYYLSVFFDK